MNFALHNKDAKLSPVYFVIRKNKKGHVIFLKYPAGFSLAPKHWNEKTERVREIYGIPFKDYNKTLDIIEREIKHIFRENDFFSITSDKIRAVLDGKLNRATPVVVESGFYAFFDKYIERKFKPGMRHIKNTKNILQTNFPALNWNAVTYSFYNDFILFLEKKSLSKNYIGRQVKTLKGVMHEAYKEKLHTNDDFRMFKVPSEKVYNVYLSEIELERLYNLELTGHLEKARDIFIVGCYTGLRVENYMNIDKDLNIDIPNNRLNVIINKNGPRISIPIHYLVKRIIDKYNGLPAPISQQKFNKYIKDVCKLEKAGLKYVVLSARTEGGKRVEKAKMKWEMISSHTARRSMATNCYLRGIPVDYIMNILGHKSPSQTIQYIKSGLDEISDRVAELDFWKEKSPAQ